MANDGSEDSREGAGRQHEAAGAHEQRRQHGGPLARLRALSLAAWLALGLGVLSLVLAGALLVLWLEPFAGPTSASNGADQGPPARQAEPGSADTRRGGPAGQGTELAPPAPANLSAQGGTPRAGSSTADLPRTLRLTSAQFQRMTLDLVPVQAGSAEAIVTAPATVIFDQERVTELGPRVEAKLVRMIAGLGDWVESGAAVAVFDSVAVGQAKARHLALEARLATARAEYERERQLARQQISSEAEVLAARARFREAQAEAEASRETLRLYGLSRQEINRIEAGQDTPLSTYRLHTPQAGYVQRRALRPGQTVRGDQTPIRIVDPSHMWVEIAAFEQALPRLDAGQSLRLTVRALPQQTFDGEVFWISDALDSQARTVRLLGRVPNPERALRAGMFGEVAIQTRAETASALVPVAAVQRLEGQSVVFRPTAQERTFRAEAVATGAEADGSIEIIGGPAPGAQVVAEGAFELKTAFTAAAKSGQSPAAPATDSTAASPPATANPQTGADAATRRGD